jgi:protein-tyrosine phosphatase
MREPIRVCFVCLGNICRSPTAEAVFLHLIRKERVADRFVVDSAGTGGYHAGERAHPETLRTAQRRGVEVPSIARQFVAGDFARFDHVIAMDEDNQRALSRLAPDDDARAKLALFRDFDPETRSKGLSVPDPYYDGGFEGVFDICDAAARGLLATLRAQHGL